MTTCVNCGSRLPFPDWHRLDCTVLFAPVKIHGSRACKGPVIWDILVDLEECQCKSGPLPRQKRSLFGRLLVFLVW